MANHTYTIRWIEEYPDDHPKSKTINDCISWVNAPSAEDALIIFHVNREAGVKMGYGGQDGAVFKKIYEMSA